MEEDLKPFYFPRFLTESPIAATSPAISRLERRQRFRCIPLQGWDLPPGSAQATDQDWS